MPRKIAAGAACWLLIAACSSDDVSPPVTQSGDGGAADTSDGAASGEAGSNTLSAPTLDKIMKMTGGLHILWTNPAGVTCDSIEGERKTDTAPYAVAFTVPGEVDNKHDATATQPTKYTYRLRCKVGAGYSPYSNELGATP